MGARKSGNKTKKGTATRYKAGTTPDEATNHPRAQAKDIVLTHGNDVELTSPSYMQNLPLRDYREISLSQCVDDSIPSTTQGPPISKSSYPGAAPYSSPHQTKGFPLPSQQSPYDPRGQDPSYYASHPSPNSSTSASGQFTAPERTDLMAATAHMQRPYPQIYNTPQSNSPASVASPTTHDQHGRSLYGQHPPQLSQPMYFPHQYSPMNHVHPSPYAQHPSQQQHHHQLTSQPMPMHHQTGPPQMPYQQPQSHPAMTNSPRMKMEPQQQQQAPAQARTPMTQAPPGPPMSANSMHSNQTPGSGTNPNAAPGPIPATTPLVVRQDNNGVQWIAFEYSRDRVKMEYTIRCDVESVNTDALSQEFKTENCVYPRACCGKDQYRGNRLNYESECNTVGWGLAELNPCLRGKRGLIQRAVDSWRNSNQDPRLRSRRVRRMAKLNNRKSVQSQPPPTHMPGSGGPGSAGIPGASNGMTTPTARAPGSMAVGGAQLHHHHAHPDGSAPGQDDVSAEAEYPSSSQPHRQPDSHPGSATSDVRPAHVYHGFPSYPPATSVGPSQAPSMYPGIDAMGRQTGIATVHAAAPEENEPVNDRNAVLFGDLPEGKRRKFILVEDRQKNNKVRVKVQLDTVNMEEVPDSYRKSISVYPRAYFPTQMQSPPSSARGQRFVSDDDDIPDNGQTTIGRILVPVPMLDGAEGEIGVPKLSRSKKNKEELLNDLGYRMSWSQSRVFAGRTIFLQQSLDAYRNKMKSTIVNANPESATVSPHFETRIGKRRWVERSRKTVHTATPPAAPSS